MSANRQNPIACLRFALAILLIFILGLLDAGTLLGQPSIFGGDYQTSSVDYVAFPIPLQVRTTICIDKPCYQYSVTFTSPDSSLAVFCPSAPCVPSTTITVQNPTDSEIASVPLYIGTLAGSFLISAATRGTTLYFHETNTAGDPTYINAAGGTPQGVLPGTSYSPLQAKVTDAYGNPNNGVLVTFSVPTGSGPTATFPLGMSSADAYTDTSGLATSPMLTAGAIPGAFTATASANGVAGLAYFSLTNLTQVTVDTSPSGLAFTVDGVTYSSTQVFSWTPGSQHTIATTSPQPGASGAQYVWTSWSDGGATSHTITASPNALFTANFATQYLLTTAASPPAGGTVGPASGYYNAGQTVALSATANPTYSFAGWTGTGSGSYTGSNPGGTVTMNGPITETAAFSATGSVAVQTNPAGRSFTVDGVTYSSAQVFSWTPGSQHAIATTSPQPGASGTQYVWTSWSDGGATSHTITASPNMVLTANFAPPYLLYLPLLIQ
jgi:hypothetical protein